MNGNVRVSSNDTSTDYKKITLKRFPATQQRETAEGRYWRAFRHPVTTQHEAPCTCMHFCPVTPHDLAITSSLAVKIYDSKSSRLSLQKTISKFKDVAYSGQWRHDGRLIASGGNEGVVRTFEATSGSPLRSLRGHNGAIHSVKWSSDGQKLLSGSDDRTVRLWDVSTEACDAAWRGHTDFVRSIAHSPVAPNTWASGSYDHTVRMWDMRQAASSATVFSVDHGAPVEDILFAPGGSVLISAGGNTIKVWDVMKGGKLIHSFSNHQKTITCLSLDGSNTRLLSGSLDGHVKIYSLQTYAVTHGLKYQAGVVSLAISPTNRHLVAALADMTVVSRNKEGKSVVEEKEEDEETVKHITGGTFRHFTRGRNSKPGEDASVVILKKKPKLRAYDKALRGFRYAEALDSALASRDPTVVVTVLEELVHRQGLVKALSGRDEVTLEPLLSFLARHTTNPRFAPLLIDVCTNLLDLYQPVLGQSEAIDELFTRLSRQVKSEADYQHRLLGLLGCMDSVINASTENANRAKAEAKQSVP